MVEHTLFDKLVEPLRPGNLFYPSAGRDIVPPIEAFSNWLSDFWFVDIRYTGRPLLAEDPRYRLLDIHSFRVSGRTIRTQQPFEVKVFHETYERTHDGRRFRVHQCRGRGYDAFRALFKSRGNALSVFFYRGDSGGEGGSGFY